MSNERLYTWKKQDFLLLTIIPLELILGAQLANISFLSSNSALLIIAGVSLFIVGMLVSIYLTRDFLASEWHVYKKKWLRNAVITIVLAAGTFAVMSVAKSITAGSAANVEAASDGEPGIFLLAFSIVPAVIAAFAEELTFRYALLGKFRGPLFKTIMFVVSSILFGLVHLNNVGGHVAGTIPYMLMGAYFGAIYVVSKNIWFSIGAHLLYNSSISLLPVLFLIIMSIFQ